MLFLMIPDWRKKNHKRHDYIQTMLLHDFYRHCTREKKSFICSEEQYPIGHSIFVIIYMCLLKLMASLSQLFLNMYLDLGKS